MKLHQILFFALIITLSISCSDNMEQLDETDYRIQFAGTYECKKVPSTVFTMDKIFIVEVVLDSTSMDKILVNDVLIPVSTNGTYGPDILDNGYHYDLQFYDDSIYVKSYKPIVNGIVMPCTLVGAKTE